MKSILIAVAATVVLWLGLSSLWMTGPDASQSAASESDTQASQPASNSCAMMASMREGSGIGGAMPGSGRSSLPQSMIPGLDASSASEATLSPLEQGIMTEPLAPVLGLQELTPTPPASSDIITSVQIVEDRLAAVPDRDRSADGVAAGSNDRSRADSQENITARASWGSQLFSVIVSGPVIGFLLIMLVIVTLTSRGRSVLLGVTGWLQRSPTGQAVVNSVYGRQFWVALKKAQGRGLAYLGSTGLDTTQGRSRQWSRVTAKAQSFQNRVFTRTRPLLTEMGLLRQDASSNTNTAFAGSQRVYGDVIHGTDANGRPLQAGVFEEGQVRAAAGLTLALGTIAFGYAYFAQIYAPIQFVTTLFFVEFLIRVTAGINYSPMGIIAHWMTRRQTPQWVSAKPKRFAWMLGLLMSFAMMIITNSGIRGPLPLTICLICLTLMWLEAVLGICLGCEIHRFLVRRGWVERDEDYEICANGVCVAEARL